MKAEAQTTRIIALAAIAVIIICFFTGCVSNINKKAQGSTPATTLHNVAFAPASLKFLRDRHAAQATD